MDYRLVRSKRRTMAIHITKDGSVELRAPLKTSIALIESFVAQKQAWIEKAQNEVLARNESVLTISKERERELLKIAKKTIPDRVKFFSGVMGVVPTAVRIGSAKTRWGSCGPKNSLNFSWRLILADSDLIDYVVVHELAHIREHNHSGRFWAMVEDVLPDYRQRRARLKTVRMCRVTE